MFSKIFTILIFGLFLIGAATMTRAAIAVENANSVSDFSLTGAARTINVPLAVASVGRTLYVGVSNYQTPALGGMGCALTTAGQTLTVTYNNQTFTRLTGTGTNINAVVAPDNCSSVEIFRLTNVNVPMGSTANVVVMQSAGADYAVVGAVSMTGVNGSTAAAGALLGATGTSNAPLLTATTAANDLLLDVLAADFNAGQINAVSQNLQWKGAFGSGLNDIGGGATKSAVGNSTTVNWSVNVADDWAIGATDIKPSVFTASPASVGGRVTRNQTAPISAARITLQDVSTGEIYTTVTDADGRYFFDALEITHLYRISIAHERYSFADDERTFNLFQSIENLDFDGRIRWRRRVF